MRLRRGLPGGWRLGVPVVAAVAGFLFVTSAVTAGGTDLRADRRTEISQLIDKQQQAVAAQQQTLNRLQADLRAAGAGVTDPRLTRAEQSVKALSGPAGFTPVSGPGVTVVLDDAPYRPGDPAYRGVPPDYLVVHQQDVEGVVNALWAGGARGVAIMGHRVVATTAIRCIGNTLWLPGQRPYSPPYTISAVGDPQRLKAALGDARAVEIYLQYVAAYHLGYQVSTRSKLDLPGYDGSADLSYAKVAR